MTFWYRWGWGR